MPLSKAKQAEWMREYRKRQACVIPKVADEVPPGVIPKLPWYAGAGDHFDEVRNKSYAQQFLSEIGSGMGRRAGFCCS